MSEKLVMSWNRRDIQVCDPTLSQQQAQEVLEVIMPELSLFLQQQAYKYIDQKLAEARNAVGSKAAS